MPSSYANITTEDLTEILLTFRRAEPGLSRWNDIYDAIVGELTSRGVNVSFL